jgi:hypothetical protein
MPGGWRPEEEEEGEPTGVVVDERVPEQLEQSPPPGGAVDEDGPAPTSMVALSAVGSLLTPPWLVSVHRVHRLTTTSFLLHKKKKVI